MKTWIFAITCLIAAASASAQDDARSLFPRETRSFQQEAREARKDLRPRAMAPTEAAPKVVYDLSLGVAYTRADGGGGHGWATPFDASATFNEKKTSIRVNGDGFARNSAGGESESGWSDVSVSATHRVYKDDNSNAKLGLGFKVGAGGSVGSDTDAFFLTASYSRKLDLHWGASASAKLRKDLNHVPAGTSPYVYSGGLQVVYGFDEGKGVSSAFAQLGRALRKGGSGSSFAVVGAEFAAFGKWTPTVSVAKGLTRGGRDTTLELDLSTQF